MVAAEATIITTLAASSYNLAFQGSAGTNLLSAAPIATVIALEFLRVPVAFNMNKTKLSGWLASAALIAGISVMTGEAASLAFENLIDQRVRPITLAERDFDKVSREVDAAKQKLAERGDKVATLTKAVEAARAHRAAVDKPVVAIAPPAQIVLPPALKPEPLPVPAAQYQNVRTKKGWVRVVSNTQAIADANKRNADIAAEADKANADNASKAVSGNAEAQRKTEEENAAAQATHDAALKTADEAIAKAQADVDKVPPLLDTAALDARLKDAQQLVWGARADNPMFRVAAAWEKIPAQQLTTEQFEAVKHWAIIALAGATAWTTALAAVISSLPKLDGRSGKLNRMARAWIARRRRAVYRDVPGPETIKEVEVVKEVPVPGPERIKEVIKGFPAQWNIAPPRGRLSTATCPALSAS